MAIPTIPFGIRARPISSGRHLPSPLTPRVIEMRAAADAVVAQPFTGVTTDGQAVPGLYSLAETGVSTRPLKAAADAFLASLDEPTARSARFDLNDGAWQRWSNI